MCLREWLELYSLTEQQEVKQGHLFLSFPSLKGIPQDDWATNSRTRFFSDRRKKAVLNLDVFPFLLSEPTFLYKTLLTPCHWICKTLSSLALPSVLKLCSLRRGRGVLMWWSASQATQVKAAATAVRGGSFRSRRPQKVLQKVEQCASFILFF